jgi:hypothetical protein
MPADSRLKEALGLTWDGLTLLSKKVEPFLRGTKVELPFAVFNVYVASHFSPR